MVSRSEQRHRLMDEYWDSHLNLGMDRPRYQEYLNSPQWRQITGRAHTLFKARCWVCGRKQRELRETREHLTTAHISYPREAFTEIVDPGDLSRSDVVLLCGAHHREFDRIQDTKYFYTVDHLRESAVDLLDQMRRQYRWDHDDED